MKRKKRWRYYCDFCGKAGGHAGHMERHEERCTLNPNRVCGFHEAQDESQPSMASLVAALESDLADWRAGWKALGYLADDCPGCILAAIRQSPKAQTALLESYEGCEDHSEILAGFDFKAEVKRFWDDHGKQAYANEGPY